MSDSWRPSAAPGALQLRARFNAAVRAFFAERGVLEVETPILSRAGNTEPNIVSFYVGFTGHVDAGPRRRWLRTSPEYPLKRLLAAGVGDCYELGRVFRDGEAGGRHNPEFTMLEWYRVGWDHLRLAEEAVEVVQLALSLVGREAAPVRTSYRDLFREHLALDPMRATDDELRAALAIDIDPTGLERDDWLDLLMSHRIQPRFAPDSIVVLHGYPASQAMLARVSGDDGDADPAPVAERFELFLGPLELANGYHELQDADEQAARFERDLARRRERGAVDPGIDNNLLAALRHGLPRCAGVALGVDRLLMAALGTDRIADVLAFDFARA